MLLSFTKSSFVEVIKKKTSSCCRRVVVTCELENCERDGGPAVQLIIGPLR